jgi:hypothetical protein
MAAGSGSSGFGPSKAGKAKGRQKDTRTWQEKAKAAGTPF